MLENWYGAMLVNQVPTILSLLTPEYQKRLVQNMYHEGNTHAPQWLAQYCWPEGFMRRWFWLGVSIQPHYVIATPDFVQIRAGIAHNFITDVNVGRQLPDGRARCRASVRRSRAGMARRSASGTATC